jgi:hypothetical protein
MKINDRARESIPRVLTALAAALLVVSCGGGGGGGGGGFTGGDDPGTATGTITGFGSIMVNGVEWDTGGATITVDDAAGTEGDLRAGQIVTIEGMRDADGVTAEADTVEVDNILEGPILLVDAAAGLVVVLEQVVIASADTSYDDSVPAGADGRPSLEDLQTGDVIEVSGYRDAQDAVRATRIGIRSGGGATFEVTGPVDSVMATSFEIGALVVDLNGLPAPTSGDIVEVEGTLNVDILEATRIDTGLGSPDGAAGDLLDVEGFVTAFTSATDFSVGKYEVVTDGDTDFVGGTSGSVALNVKVEVQGELQAGGSILADTVEFRVQPDDANVEVVGFVSAVSAASGTVTINGLNVVANVDASTRLEDRTGDDGVLALADLVAGDYVAVYGVEDPSAATNDVRATRLERLDAGDEVVLRGVVQLIADPDLRILGVTVETDSAVVFRDVVDDPITQAAFFATLLLGDVVKVTAPDDAAAGAVLVGEELEIEAD